MELEELARGFGHLAMVVVLQDQVGSVLRGQHVLSMEVGVVPYLCYPTNPEITIIY